TNARPNFLAPSFEVWLRQRLQNNVPYDRIVREMLTAPLSATERERVYPEPGEGSPLAFFQAAELKPENLAANTSRLFLGVKLECPQCHNHPFAHWTRKQFWEYAAFFAGIEAPQGVFGPVNEVADRRQLKIAGTDKVVTARLLDGREPPWKAAVAPRVTLTDW